jgi:hypothetical protein
MTVEQISEEVRRDNEFYDRWFTEWDAYFSESNTVTHSCLIVDLIGVPQGNYIRDLRKCCPENYASCLRLMAQYYRQSVMPCEWISKLSCSCTNDL